MKISIILIFVLIPNLLAKCTLKEAGSRFKRSVYEFSTELLTKIAKEKENHFVASTLSAWTILVTTSLGAADTTLEEMKQVLNLEKDVCFNKKFLKIASSVTSYNTDVILERSSNIYVDDKLKILKLFKKTISDNSMSKFENLSFEDADLAAKIINDYVSHATHKTINKIVSPGDLEEVLMVITDAVYFKGSWQTRFLNESTTASPFYNTRGMKIGDVNMMFTSSLYKVVAADGIGARVLELPYENGKRYSMFVYLPFDDVPLYSVIEKLKLTNISTINEMFDQLDKAEVRVQIPRFKITSDLSNLKELLIDMGLKTMFNPEAHFPLISHVSLYVSNLIQKADIEVTEEGTVASAVTRADLSSRFGSNLDVFIANKPFLFMIVDKKVELPIFMGAYSKPSLF